MEKLSYYLLSLIAALIVLTVHEYSHGYAAYRLGDPTARNMGRLSLNPIKHIDPIGALCMVIFHFGWAKPVPINPRYFRKPKRDFAITALAGPLSNLILGFFGAFAFLLVYALVRNESFDNAFTFSLVENTLNFLLIFHSINVGIALFNLIPIPPLDGSRLLAALLPERAYFKLMRYENKIYLIFLGWLLIGDFIVEALQALPFIAAIPALSTALGFLSISNLLGYLIGIVSDLMLSFWQLIPFLKM